MNTTQPNFEKVKTAFYNTFKDCAEVDFSILCHTINDGKLLESFHRRKQTFKKDFNTWLDRVDIRSVSSLVSAIGKAKNPHSLPSWIKYGSFSIDYNDRESLDLIKAEKELY